MKESSPRSSENSIQPDDKAGEKPKSKNIKLRAPIADAVKTEVKAPIVVEMQPPKIPLHELFAREEEAEKDKKKGEDKDKDSADKSTKKAKTDAVASEATAEKVATDAAKELKPKKAAEKETKVEEIAPEALEFAEVDAAGEQASAEKNEDGLLIINHEAEGYELSEDEPAPVAAPPIMYDIPLNVSPETVVDLTPAIAEAGDGGKPPILPPFEAAPADNPEEPDRTPVVEAAGPDTLAEEQRQAENRYNFFAGSQPEQVDYPNVKTAAEVHAAEREKADTEYYAEKRGRRGILGTVVISYLFGRHRGRVRAERTTAKELKKRDAQVEKLEAEQAASEVKKNVLSGALEQVQAKARGVEEKLKELVNRSKPESEPQQSAEASAAHAKAVEKRLEVMKTMEKLKPVTEVLPEDKEISEATYAAPEGRRYETSAWHRYEELIYGEEFKREQKQERLQPEPVATGAAFQIGHAMVLGTDSGAQGPVVDFVAGVTQADLQPEFDPYKPPRTNIQPKEMAQTVVGYARQPIIWLAAAVVVVLLFSLGILH
jgi:hypothetical protein